MLLRNVKVILLVYVVCSFSCENEDNPICPYYRPSDELDIYKYPLRPGMPGWELLKSGEEMYAVTQLPDSVRQDISTAGLIETCYDYPLLLNMIAWPTLQQGVEAIVEIFNGFQELGQRNDGANMLLARYMEINLACTAGFQTDVELGQYTLTNSLLENVLAQEIFLSNLSSKERKTLLAIALENYTIKKRLADTYGTFDLKSSAIIMARVMIKEQYPQFLEEVSKNQALQLFIEEIELQENHETLDVVEHYAIVLKFS